MKQITKLAVGIATFVAMMPINALAWGPERATYTNESPAPKATFNSITNNAAVGDEREFVRIREKGVGNYTANADDSGFVVEPGKTYEVYIYYHNDAASNTNETGEGIASGVKINSHFSEELVANEKGYVNATIAAADTEPLAVWDELKIISEKDAKLVASAATIHNSWKTDGMTLGEGFFTDDGAYLGVNSLNGVVFGCAEYSGYVTYELEVKDKVVPAPEKTCATNPEMEGCQELPNTGPLEIVLAIVVVLGIGAGIFYLIRSRRTLKKAEDQSIGKEEDDSGDDGASQNPDNVIK